MNKSKSMLPKLLTVKWIININKPWGLWAVLLSVSWAHWQTFSYILHCRLNEMPCVHAELCPTLCAPMDCSLPGSSIHGIFQALILEWVAFSFSRGSSWPRDWTQVSRIASRFFPFWATRGSVFVNLYLLC